MPPAERSAAVKRRAAELGFSATGVAALGANPHAAELDGWLAAGDDPRFMSEIALRLADQP